MIRPRVFWLCTHSTLRYEEVPLLLEAGTETIPAIGDPFWLKYDQNYDNETDTLYPQWRRTCSLPTHIVAQLRGIDLFGKRGIVTAQEAELFNRWIDVIFVSSYPQVLYNIMKWFQGYLVFRVFGHGDFTTYTEQMQKYNVSLDVIAAADKYVWCPILKSLDVPEDNRIIKNKLHLNSFVSSERLGLRWRERNSKQAITTTISYMDVNPAARDIFNQFEDAFAGLPFRILGKYSRDAVDATSEKVIGYLDDQAFFAELADSRLFVYVGLGSNFHVHYTPIEAVKMGVPIVFLETSGLAQEARDCGFGNPELQQIGMCSNVAEMKTFVLRVLDDFEALTAMANAQASTFGKIFNRDTALHRAREFFEGIQEYVMNHRQAQDAEPPTFNVIARDYFRAKSIETDLPTENGQEVTFSMETVNCQTGRIVYNYQGEFLGRRVEAGSDSPGLFIDQFIGKMAQGTYELSLVLNSASSCTYFVGALSFGVWSPQFQFISVEDIKYLRSGENVIKLAVSVSPDIADVTKELRLAWNGNHTFDVTHLTVVKTS